MSRSSPELWQALQGLAGGKSRISTVRSCALPDGKMDEPPIHAVVTPKVTLVGVGTIESARGLPHPEADPQLQYPQFSEYVNGVEEINGDFKTQLNESLSTKEKQDVSTQNHQEPPLAQPRKNA
eukprot:2130948-Amphidinium_carterae.2